MRNNIVKYITYLPIVVLFSFLGVLVASLNAPIFDYDDAGQFFISKGLNHYSAPYSSQGTLSDVMYQNANYNLDPGGYSILLHFWTYISNDVIWCRSLAFLFFILSVLLALQFIKKNTRSLNWAFIGVSLFFLFDAFVIKATNVRGYTMEMLGGILVLYLVSVDRWNISKLTLAGFTIAIFCTSRYAFIPLAFVACFIIILYDIITRSKYYGFVFLLIPIFAVLLLIHHFSYSIQSNGGVMDVYSGQYISANPKMLLRFWILPTVLSIFEVYKNRYNSFDMWFRLSLLIFLTNAGLIIASCLNLHPWGNDKCYSINTCSLVYFVLYIHRHFSGKKIFFPFQVFLISLLCLKLFTVIDKKSHQNGKDSFSIYYGLPVGTYDKVFVDPWETPSVRYNFEYGPFKKERIAMGYPEKFYFGYGTKHSSKDINLWMYDKNEMKQCDHFLLLKDHYPIINEESLNRLSKFIYKR